MKTKYALQCLAPDGEHVTEGREFDTVEAAWNRADDMGSRWIFYPVSVVTTAGRAAVIRSLPHGISEMWEGKHLATLKKAFAANSEHVADYCNGKCPFMILP